MRTTNGDVFHRQVMIDSDIGQGQRIQSDIVALARSCDYPESDLFAIHLAVEEAMVNAIKHGNGSDPKKKVRVGYKVTPKFVRVRIEDEGSGFDPDGLPDPTDPEFLDRPCGRGVMFIRHYMFRVVFNNKGNGVVMLIRKKENVSDAEDSEEEAA